jgi:multidrug resistance efflux pump
MSVDTSGLEAAVDKACETIDQLRAENLRLRAQLTEQAQQMEQLRGAIGELPRYEEADIVKRPSTAEYVSADDLAHLLAALQTDPRQP